MLSADSSNSRDIRLHSGDSVTGENSALVWFCSDAPITRRKLSLDAPLTRDRALCSTSSWIVAIVVEVAFAVSSDALINSVDTMGSNPTGDTVAFIMTESVTALDGGPL